MAKITCHDIDGKLYEVDESELVDTQRVYGINFVDNKVLMVNDIRSDLWELPGGGMEEGEDEIQTLAREIKEETGLDIVNPRRVYEYIDYFYSDLKNIAFRANRIYYLISVGGGKILSKGNKMDTQKARYFLMEEIKSLPVKYGDKEVILKVLDF